MTHAPNGAWSPAWSPDGTRIAYEALDSGHVLGLYVLDVASGESTQVTGVNADYERAGDATLRAGQPLEPQFTPDGSSLVYTGGSEGHPVIRIVPVAGGNSTVLIGPRGNLRDAENGSLSPDGSLVTFLGDSSAARGRDGGWPTPTAPNGDSSRMCTGSRVHRILPELGPLMEAGSCARRPAGSSSSTSRREPPRLSPGVERRSGSTITRCSYRSEAKATRRTERPSLRARAVHPAAAPGARAAR